MADKKDRRKPGFFTSILFGINLLAILVLITSYLSFYIDPSIFALPAFAGLAYPYILLVNLAFLLFWLFVRIRYALFTLIFILVGWNHLGKLYQLSGNDENCDAETQFKIVSYNLQNFLKLNTSSTKYVTDFENEEKIMDFLKSEKADVYFLQEVLNDRQSRTVFMHDLMKQLKCRDHHHRNYFVSNKKILDAVVILSKYPLYNKGFLEHDGKSIAIFADMVHNEDTIRIYNLHLASIHFREEDYKFWSEFGNNNKQENIREGTRQIAGKMKEAFRKRSAQTNMVLKHMEQSPYPVILCGDFNDTPFSYAYQRLSQNRNDAFTQSGQGLGSSYAGDNFPAFRIDFILLDPEYSSSDFKTHNLKLSDHLPLSTYVCKSE